MRQAGHQWERDRGSRPSTTAGGVKSRPKLTERPLAPEQHGQHQTDEHGRHPHLPGVERGDDRAAAPARVRRRKSEIPNGIAASAASAVAVPENSSERAVVPQISASPASSNCIPAVSALQDLLHVSDPAARPA